MRSIIVFLSLISVTAALNCYICNSLSHVECTNDFDKFLKVCPVKSFGGMKAVKPVGCRVTRQYVNDETSIVRECAYTGEDIERKSNKGSLGVSRVYSQCSETACNSSQSVSQFLFAAIILAIFKLTV